MDNPNSLEQQAASGMVFSKDFSWDDMQNAALFACISLGIVEDVRKYERAVFNLEALVFSGEFKEDEFNKYQADVKKEMERLQTEDGREAMRAWRMEQLCKFKFFKLVARVKYKIPIKVTGLLTGRKGDERKT